jgi:Flp pilus assembly pilin Flp
MKHKAQAYLDYAALIAIVSLALMAMSSYVLGGVKARIKHTKADLSDFFSGVR